MKRARLESLLRELSPVNPRLKTELPAGDTPITGIHHDSRRVTSGSLFVCLPGLSRDGHEFALRAREAGAELVIGERPEVNGSVPYVQVDDSRKALALLASAFQEHPSRQLDVVAVTGTNGKSSVTWMIEGIARAAGRRAAVMGTLGIGRPGALRPQPFTTPEAPDFQAELARLANEGVDLVAVEVSSHGLELRRTYGTRFAATVFTNLSQDHLDFHQTMERYAAAKNRLFRVEDRGVDDAVPAVVNAEDPHLEAVLRGSTDRVLRFGRARGEVQASAAQLSPNGIRLEVRHPRGTSLIRSPLLGSFQVDNLLAAFAVGLVLSFDPDIIVRGLEQLGAIPGRMERVDAGAGVLIVVDYAHTPDALGRAIESLRPFSSGRVLVVFGCGGDRDQSKRYRMGQIAAQADRIYLTDDNPRSEDPALIRRAVREGVEAAGADVIEEGDRARAIELAVHEARAGDILLIAGKGHETVQIRGDGIIPFDDREVARQSARRVATQRSQPPVGGKA